MVEFDEQIVYLVRQFNSSRLRQFETLFLIVSEKNTIFFERGSENILKH